MFDNDVISPEASTVNDAIPGFNGAGVRLKELLGSICA
jgi:hypothetical protein